jgi:hypothetical protein
MRPVEWTQPHTGLATKNKWVGLTCGAAGWLWKNKPGGATAPPSQGPCVVAPRLKNHPVTGFSLQAASFKLMGIRGIKNVSTKLWANCFSDSTRARKA